MFWSGVVNFFKRCWLYIVRGFSRCFRNLGFKLSILFVFFSFIISLFFLIPSLFSRTPILGSLIETMELPLSYEYVGKVIIFDEEGNQVEQAVDVYVGGYSVSTMSGEEFVLKFSSEMTDYFYLILEYKRADGSEEILTKRIETEGRTTLEGVIQIHE